MGRIIFGTSGWSYDDWVGPFYRTSQQNKLSFYSKIFKTAEIDSTFYAYPSRGMVMGWLKFTEPDFSFTTKVPQLITHEKKLDMKQGVEEDLNRFCDLMKPLQNAGKLGCLLIQLPPKFKLDLRTLEDFLQILPEDFRFALELRHLSWMTGETWKLLENYKVAYTVVDEPLLPPEIHVTADFAYVRWHGRGKRPWYNYLYKPEELEPWIPKIKQISDATETTYGYFNNHFHGYAVENCLQVLEMLGDLSPEQAEAKKAADEYLESKVSPKVEAEGLFAYVPRRDVEGMSFEELLQGFLDQARLKRAQKIKDSEVNVQEVTEDQVRAMIREYHVLVDQKNQVILHDCADWSRCIHTKQFCKHLGKIFLSLPRDKSSTILKRILSERERWEFKPYVA